ncbi:dTDP-4-dehydrorhamnose 3,5-epimerase [Sphingobacteriales bacterium CHB3]|nr:dTDP-4-dehydrorhamnose 3,5-epimerase [Sphingobacteriales bacterium CHB3]
MFKTGKIEGVIVKNLIKFIDERGWLVETFRQDELEEQFFPVMGYISMTNAGVARGPHEHIDQADNFAFLGPSNFKVYLWDNRKSSPTYMVRQIVYAGEDAPKSVVIPAGVVHAYKNVGGKQGMVVNSPNRLFAGTGKKDPVDEVRHEDDPNSIFKLD